MTDTTTQFKKQLPRNSFFQGLSFISHVAIGIWLVPYLVKHLGRAAYGLIPIAGVMTQYVSLVSYSISSAVNRFLTIALQQDDTQEANRIFNTAFFSYLTIGLLQIPVFGLIIYYANTVFTIPKELYNDAITLLTCSAASFVLNLVFSVFTVPMYANNRLDLSRSIDIGREVVRLISIVILFMTFGPSLRYVGYVDLALTVVLCITYVRISKRLAPVLQVRLRCYQWRKVRQLTEMGLWLLVNQVAFLLLLRVDVWVCNRFVGAEEAGDYAAILQWSNLIRYTGGIMAAIIGPMIVIYYAKSELDHLIRLAKASVRIFSVFLVVPISMICVFSTHLIRVWLGDSFVRLWPLMVVMVCHLVINVGVLPFFNIQIALNKVRWPAIISLALGLLNVALAITLAKYTKWGIYGVAIANALVLLLRNAFFIPIYGALILQQRWHAFIRSYLSALALLVGLLLIGFASKSCIPATSLTRLIVFFVCFGTFGFLCSWLLLSKQDQKLVFNIVPARFRGFVAKLDPNRLSL